MSGTGERLERAAGISPIRNSYPDVLATDIVPGPGLVIVRGTYRDEVAPLMREAQRLLRKSFRQLGAVLIPTSFKVGLPGADVHYAASLPMHAKPALGQTDRYGELAGVSGIHVVDGASLSSLPAKSHTLTIMANADRIGKHLAKILASVESAA